MRQLENYRTPPPGMAPRASARRGSKPLAETPPLIKPRRGQPHAAADFFGTTDKLNATDQLRTHGRQPAATLPVLPDTVVKPELPGARRVFLTAAPQSQLGV